MKAENSDFPVSISDFESILSIWKRINNLDEFYTCIKTNRASSFCSLMLGPSANRILGTWSISRYELLFVMESARSSNHPIISHHLPDQSTIANLIDCYKLFKTNSFMSFSKILKQFLRSLGSIAVLMLHEVKIPFNENVRLLKEFEQCNTNLNIWNRGRKDSCSVVKWYPFSFHFPSDRNLILPFCPVGHHKEWGSLSPMMAPIATVK